MADPDDDAKGALKTLGLGPAAQELYADMLRPAAKELGKNIRALAQVVTIAFQPVHGLVWGFERIKEWLSAALLKRLARVPPEKIQAPPAYVAGQALLNLTFCADEDQLRELYANLLASAMNKDMSPQVHPSFVQIIQQLSPDEALLLRVVASEGLSLSETTYSEDRNEKTRTLDAEFREVCTRAGVARIDQAQAYLDNLIRLRILTERHWNEGTYDPPRHSHYFGEQGASIVAKEGRVIEVSTYGESFMKACI